MRACKGPRTSLKGQRLHPHKEEIKPNSTGNIFNEVIDLLVLVEIWTPKSIKSQIHKLLKVQDKESIIKLARDNSHFRVISSD